MKRSIAQLKEWFRRGKYPTEAQFADWMDSYVHKDGVVPLSQVENLAWLLNGKFSASRGEALEVLMQALRREFDRHKEDADDEFEKIENNRQALVAEDERQQAEIDAQQAQITAAAGQLETVRKLLHSGASWANIKGAFDGLGSNYNSLWALARTVKTFLEAADTSDATINRWQELEAFLQGVTDDKSLTGLLEEQAEKIGAAHLKDLKILAEQLSCENKTYGELVELRNSGKLMPGTLYRITDYITTVANDPEARSAGHPFDVVVMALDAGTLSERAWAMPSARDTSGYFAGAKLEAWQVWYCLDNDATRFQWADTATGKGVIYRLIDEWGNDCPYDFKNVQFKRCLTSGDFVDNVVDDADWPNTHYILSPSMNGQADMTADETDYKWLYTFTYLEQMQDVRDASLINEVNADFESAYYNKACNCNEMQAYYIGEFIDDTTFATQALNNIVLSSYDEENGAAVKMYGNKWGAGCFNMTFHEHCYGNSFGVNCYCLIGFKLYYNTFGNGCNYNTFGNSCGGNTFGNYFWYNTFGNSCNGNTFGNSCGGNTFGNSCGGNTFGNSCVGNTFGNDFYRNTFGNDCDGNTFGNSCNGNTFGNYFRYNTFGNECYNNTFGNSCVGNTFGNYFQYNTFGNDFYRNTFGNYLQYITAGEGVKYLNVTGGSDVKHFVQNAHILNGTSGKDSKNLLTVGLPEMSTVCRYVGQNTAGVLKIWVPADLV